MRAVMQFAVVSLIVLPVLPDQDWGPYGVFNPRRIWWMVVLITGISLGSYVGYRWLGHRAGSILGGILGGLISSHCNHTVSTARETRVQDARASDALGALVIQIAGTVVFAPGPDPDLGHGSGSGRRNPPLPRLDAGVP